MIGKLIRRLGFQQSVPVSLLDSWLIPTLDMSPIELAPRDGAASCLVDQHGRIQVDGETWGLDLTLAAGARWVPVMSTEKVEQRLVAPAVVETSIRTPAGPVVQRVAAGIVDGQPVAVVEIENAAGVAVAVGLVARPLRHDGRGYIAEASGDVAGLTIEGRQVVRFDSGPASVKAATAVDGDLLQALPAADDATRTASASCRSGGAQVAAVWPLPHTATLRLVIELDQPTASDAPVPSTSDINRGWQSHLRRGMCIEVDGDPIDEDVAVAARSLLTLWPSPHEAPAAITALSELGFGRDATRLFSQLERTDDDDDVVRALARWAQLGESAEQLDDLEAVLGRLGRAAHVLDNRSTGSASGPPWLDAALIALGGRLHQIGQPDVADRIQTLKITSGPAVNHVERLARMSKARTDRGLWPDATLLPAADLVSAARSVVLDDAGRHLRVLPSVPRAWRGRTIDALGVPVANGSLSFGLRWHGPRPALLWESNLAPDAPMTLTVPGIDPDFSTQEREGEVLLADPRWQAP